MKREYSVIKDPEVGLPGDEDAVSAAMALANRFDGPTLRLIHDTFTSLEFIGGQLAVAVRRAKYDDWGREIPYEEQNDVPGQWRTTGFVFAYDSRDVTLRPAKPIDAEVEVTDVDRQVPDAVAVRLEEEAERVEESGE